MELEYKIRGVKYRLKLEGEELLKVQEHSRTSVSTNYFLLKELYPLFMEFTPSIKRELRLTIAVLLLFWLLVFLYYRDFVILLIVVIPSFLIALILMLNDYRECGQPCFIFDSESGERLYLPYNRKNREKIHSFAKELSRLALQKFIMFREQDPSRTKVLLEDLEEEKILSDDEIRRLKKWYFPDDTEKQPIGFTVEA